MRNFSYLSVSLILFLILTINVTAYSIINMHEHIQSINEADKLIKAMDENNISITVLLGSPKQTLYFKGGFSGYDENNEELLKIKKAYPDRFIIFVTINPVDFDKLEKLERYVEDGAVGLKLYTGHTLFYNLSLDNPAMDEVYMYSENNDIPIVWHVNPYYYQEGFENVLKKYPKLKVICPHFCLSSINDERLRYLLDAYPNLYVDISFGYDPYAEDGFKRVSKNSEKFRDIFTKYQDRFLFGTDNVITNHPKKDLRWISNFSKCYKDMLEKESYSCFLIDETLNGLNLDKETLKKIYKDNPEKFLGIDSKRNTELKNKKEGTNPFLIILLFLIIIFISFFYFVNKKKRRFKHSLAKTK